MIIKLHTELISTWFKDQGAKKQNTFAFYIRLSVNKIIYNATPQRIHNLTGLSIYTINKYLPLCIEEGLMFWQGKNLVCRSIRKLGSEYKNPQLSQVDIGRYNTLQTIKRKLRQAIMVDKLISQQKFMIKLRSKITFASPKSAKEWRQTKRNAKKYLSYTSHVGRSRFNLIRFGYRKLSLCLGTHQSEVKLFLDSLVYNNVLYRYSSTREKTYNTTTVLECK